MKTALLLLLSAFTLAAQPGPAGQSPPWFPGPGRLPRDQGQPGQQGQRGSRRAEQKRADLTQSFSGVIRKLDAKSFELEALDTRFLSINMLDTTTKPPDLRMGDGVDVVANQDKDGLFQAVSIRFNRDVAATIEANDRLPGEALPEEVRTGPPPTILERPGARYDPGDSGPPKLKRGKPVQQAADSSSDAAPLPAEQASHPAPARPAANSRQEFVEQARGVAATFLEGLPNYVCQESATRYVSETREPNWNVVDVVSAEVVFEDGQERYRNVAINNKPTKKSPEESGAWSTGEFGTILGDLFSLRTAADFKYMQGDTIEHQPASIYDFKVDRRRSAWKISVPGQYILPAYKGSVWLDKQSAHTLRLEMQAREIPEGFPRISVETAVDYDYVTLGTPEKFLLPVHAEILSCSRESNECERNVIEFRNYHKFTGESTIKFNDQ